MTSPLHRIRLGAVVLVIVLAMAVAGYHYLDGDSDWIDDIYLVVITVSSVGYGEESHFSRGEQLFTIAVIIFGMSAAIYTVGGFLQLMTEGEIARALGVRRMTHEIHHLKDHVIVCGFGRIGRMLSSDLAHRKKNFVVVEREADRVQDALALGYTAYNGDALDDAVLTAVGVERAKALVTALPQDADNVFITLTARNANPDLFIIARGEQPGTQRKLLQAGANRVVQPALTGARQMASLITRPSTVEFLEMVGDNQLLDVEFDEFTLPADSPLAGITLEASNARQIHNVAIVAIKPPEGKMVINPGPNYEFKKGDTVIVIGDVAGIERFRKEYRV